MQPQQEFPYMQIAGLTRALFITLILPQPLTAASLTLDAGFATSGAGFTSPWNFPGQQTRVCSS